MSRRLRSLFLLGFLIVTALLVSAGSASAAPKPGPSGPIGPTSSPSPTGPVGLTIDVGGKPSSSLVVLILLTVLSIAPSILLLTTCFTKIIVVLSLSRNALGLMNVPPNQVLAGLALFLSLFVMGPTFTSVWNDGVQPFMDGTKTTQQAFDDGSKPLKGFMLLHTRDDELALLTKVAGTPAPKDRASVPITTLIPAFILSELKSAFIIGFVILIPFLVLDLVIAAILMSLGMVMLPPVVVSLPFKLLLFVMVDGWSLVITALVGSYRTGG